MFGLCLLFKVPLDNSHITGLSWPSSAADFIECVVSQLLQYATGAKRGGQRGEGCQSQGCGFIGRGGYCTGKLSANATQQLVHE